MLRVPRAAEFYKFYHIKDLCEEREQDAEEKCKSHPYILKGKVFGQPI
jgi:hypothetical protein